MIEAWPALSNEENVELIKKAQEEYKSSGGKKQTLMEEAIRRNMGLVYYILNKFGSTLLEYGCYDEAYSRCLIKLFNLFEYFDESKGIFSTFAGLCLENEVKMEIRRNKKGLREVSLDKVVIYDDEGNDLILKDTIEDPGSSDYQNFLMRNHFYRALFEKLPLFLSEKDYQLFDLKCQGFHYHEIREIMGDNYSRSYYTKRMLQINSFIKELIDFDNVQDIQKYIENNNIRKTKVRQTLFRYDCAKHIFNNKKLDFDKSFDFIKFSLKEQGLLKKVDNIFHDKQNSKLIYSTLANLHGLDLKALRQKEKDRWSISTTKSERRFNDHLNDLYLLATRIKEEKLWRLLDVNDLASRIQDIAVLNFFSGDLSPIIEGQRSKMNKEKTAMFHESEQQIQKAESEARLQLQLEG